MRPFQVYVDRAALCDGQPPIAVRDTRNGHVERCVRAALDDAVILLAPVMNADGARVYIEAASVTVEGEQCPQPPSSSRSSEA